MSTTRQHVDSAGVTLSVTALGDEDAPPLVMLHGIRDVGASLLPLAERLAATHRVVIPDLRGHGDSGRPGHYAMHQFVYDLHRVIDGLGLAHPVVFGHSMGGQIAARFAALFPESVRALVIVEGLGPPRRATESAVTPAIRAQLLGSMALEERSRPLPDIAFASARLRANNPRLTAAFADRLAERCTTRDPDGTLRWKFDPRASQVWLTVDDADTRRYWRAVACPTLVVSGALAGEYWRGQRPANTDWDPDFDPRDLAERLACFADARHVHLDDAGHMVHYDAPDALARHVVAFIEEPT